MVLSDNIPLHFMELLLRTPLLGEGVVYFVLELISLGAAEELLGRIVAEPFLITHDLSVADCYFLMVQVLLGSTKSSHILTEGLLLVFQMEVIWILQKTSGILVLLVL
mmetsp:Transcript_4168/g.6205  ORF Transcript_4168/g.6205 Transcript_4168/m.6205 type:complete len:108 (-) Transcript_4168:882-1205(-)